jgi:hypothetical protein
MTDQNEYDDEAGDVPDEELVPGEEVIPVELAPLQPVQEEQQEQQSVVKKKTSLGAILVVYFLLFLVVGVLLPLFLGTKSTGETYFFQNLALALGSIVAVIKSRAIGLRMFFIIAILFFIMRMFFGGICCL